MNPEPSILNLDQGHHHPWRTLPCNLQSFHRLVFGAPLRTLTHLFKGMSRMGLLTGPEALETIIKVAAFHTVPPEAVDGLEKIFMLEHWPRKFKK